MTQAAGMCDIATGVCAVTGSDELAQTGEVAARAAPASTKVSVIYVTDPICSACWVSEPAWRSVSARYGDRLDVRYVYGGLLPSWNGFSDARAGISGPGDVAHHWEEFSEITGQPIDPSMWHTDPLGSSFPPSITAVAVRLIAPEREEAFLRRIRELLFLDARNIARHEVLVEAAASVGVDAAAFEQALEDGSAEAAFLNDLRRTQSLGARGFPTLYVEGPEGRLILHGAFSPEKLEQAVLSVSGEARLPYLENVDEAVGQLGVGTTLEYAATLGLDAASTESALSAAGMNRSQVGKGVIWKP